jgi:class 3 adenylate cyclase
MAGLLEQGHGDDVSDLLSSIKVPSLALHRLDDAFIPFRLGQKLATQLPNARFIPLKGKVHAIYLGQSQAVLDEIETFLGGERAVHTQVKVGIGSLVTILFTDIVSSTALTQRLGDARAQELVRAHNAIVRDALRSYGGTEIKHTGDGIMASFPTASGALECAVEIQRNMEQGTRNMALPRSMEVHIGLNAGEPMAEESDLFGTSVQLARRICDHATTGQILVSNVVRELAAGKGFLFADIGEVVPKGFEEPVRLYEVRWRE